MGKGEYCNVTVLALVAPVKHTADGGHYAEDCMDQVFMRHNDPLGNSSAAAGVHDYGRVRGIRWRFTLGRRGTRGENGGKLVEGNGFGVVGQRLRFVAEQLVLELVQMIVGADEILWYSYHYYLGMTTTFLTEAAFGRTDRSRGSNSSSTITVLASVCNKEIVKLNEMVNM